MGLNGCDVVFQIDRLRLLFLIQEWMSLRGQALSPPFQLRIPPDKKRFEVEVTYPSIEVVISSVDLAFDVGTDHGHLLLVMSLGVLRVPGETELKIRGGTIDVDLEFRDAISVRPLSAKFQNLLVDGTPTVSGFDALANVEADHLLDIDRNIDFEVLHDGGTPNPFKALALIRGVNKCTDPNTFSIMIGGPPGVTVPRLIQGSGLLLAESVDIVKSQILKPSLKAQLLDPKDPSADLPPPWGSGKIPKDQDGIHTDITRLDLDFKDGYIAVSGKFDAHNDCWTVQGGTFWQNLYLDIKAGPGIPDYYGNTATLVPRLDPASPNVDYDADIAFMCHLVEAVIGILPGLAGAAIYGIGLIIAIEILKASFSPSIPASSFNAVPLVIPIENVTWDRFWLTEEGAIIQGTLVGVLAHPVLPSLSISVSDETELTGGSQGQVLSGPPCAPKLFDYQEAGQRHDLVFTAKPHLLIEPVAYEWSINGSPLRSQKGVLRYSDTVTAGLPPPSGTDIPNHPIEIAYQAGIAGSLAPLVQSGETLEIQTRDGDLNYQIRVDVRATDAVNRHYYYGLTPKIIGDLVLMGPDFDAYIGECLRELRDSVNKKGRKQTRPKPGQPQEGLQGVISHVLDHVELGNSAAHQLIEGAVQAYGAKAVANELQVQAEAVPEKAFKEV
jgi:hypothetical protein